MKAYILRIELDESDPLIWRKVIMPAGATYKRLHDVIQNATNFLGGYPSNAYHFYDFHLREEGRWVTNDEEAYDNHIHYKKNKNFYAERLENTDPHHLPMEESYQAQLQKEVRKPSGLKIDDYLEKHKVISYNYDYGDDWWFTIRLEEIVDDYYFGYPSLLDGAQTAPPEDVGGLPGFYYFLDVYHDPNHRDHQIMKERAQSMGFRIYDPNYVNDCLKGIVYKKTQWDKINHDHYRVIEDKYRKKW